MVTTELGHLRVATGLSGDVLALLLPGALELDATGTITATVTARRFAGDHHVLHLRAGGADLEVPVRGLDPPRSGDEVTLRLDPRLVRVLPDEPSP